MTLAGDMGETTGDNGQALGDVLGRRMEMARVWRGLTQTELAERAGVSSGTILNSEQGHTSPQLASLRAVAHALDVDLRWLLDGPDPPAFTGDASALAIGARIRHQREEHGISSRALAAELDTRLAQVAAIEAGTHDPRLDRLGRIATVLDVPLAWLLTGEP